MAAGKRLLVGRKYAAVRGRAGWNRYRELIRELPEQCAAAVTDNRWFGDCDEWPFRLGDRTGRRLQMRVDP